MYNMKNLSLFIFIISFCLLIFSHEVKAVNADGGEYDSITLDGDLYSISCDWLNPCVYPASISYQSTDFFVYGDKLYLNHLDVDEGTFQLHVVDAESGKYLGPVAIDWNGLPHSPYASHFVGADSEGTPYVSSYSNGAYQNNGYPFTVTTLAIVDGKPVAQKVYNFTIDNSWWTNETSIAGSLASENFTLAVNISRGSSKQSPWGYAMWKVADGAINFVGASQVGMSLGSVKALADGRVIIHNCRIPVKDEPECMFGVPTLCSFTDSGELAAIDHYDLESSDATGIDVCTFRSKQFLLYGHSFSPAKYGIAQLADFPSTLAANAELWTLGGSQPFSLYSENINSVSSEHKVMAIHADTNTENELKLYTLTNKSGLARYTITTKANDSTGIENVVTATGGHTTYFTLGGSRLSRCPTSPGIYISVSETEISKVIIK